MEKIGEHNILLVNIQLIFSIATFVLFLISIFNDGVNDILRFFVSITLFILAFNNHKIYKKKAMTFVYLGFAIMIAIYEILLLIGVL